jgi:membrane protease YdiL (CAAX protease family)
LAALGYPSFPVLQQKFSVAPDESNTGENTADNPADTRAETADSIQPGNSILYETPEQRHVSDKDYPAVDLVLDINWKAYFLTIFGVSIIGILYSVILFSLTSPQLSDMLQKTIGPASAEFENAVTVQTILLVLEFAVAEELIFRLGIQSFLVKYLKLEGARYWIAILITSALWTLGHVGGLDPEWVKLAQVFPVGLMLGWLFRKYGVESTILAHGLFNVVLGFLPPHLLG